VERPVKGDIVVIPFPFSDLTQTKRRPALIIASLEGDDVILCQITSQSIKDKYAIQVNDNDFETGALKQPSNIRPNRLFTIDSHIISYRIGSLKPGICAKVVERIIEIVGQ